MVTIAAYLVASYLCGSIATSIWVGRWVYGLDVREHGSGNAGATNVYRVLGWRPALFVVIVDVAKGWAPTWLAVLVFSEMPPVRLVSLQIAIGVSAILGHVWTVFAGFRGGKGVGTAAGVLLALFPIAVPICILVFGLVVWRTGLVSLASITAVCCFPIVLAVLQVYFGQSIAPPLWGLAAAIVPFIIYTHRSNLKRLLAGEENRFHKKK